ncbi:hypothetical protein BKA93DRAFT_878090 [Sparassis latifolia]
MHGGGGVLPTWVPVRNARLPLYDTSITNATSKASYSSTIARGQKRLRWLHRPGGTVSKAQRLGTDHKWQSRKAIYSLHKKWPSRTATCGTDHEWPSWTATYCCGHQRDKPSGSPGRPCMACTKNGLPGRPPVVLTMSGHPGWPSAVLAMRVTNYKWQSRKAMNSLHKKWPSRTATCCSGHQRDRPQVAVQEGHAWLAQKMAFLDGHLWPNATLGRPPFGLDIPSFLPRFRSLGYLKRTPDIESTHHPKMGFDRALGRRGHRRQSADFPTARPDLLASRGHRIREGCRTLVKDFAGISGGARASAPIGEWPRRCEDVGQGSRRACTSANEGARNCLRTVQRVVGGLVSVCLHGFWSNAARHRRFSVATPRPPRQPEACGPLHPRTETFECAFILERSRGPSCRRAGHHNATAARSPLFAVAKASRGLAKPHSTSLHSPWSPLDAYKASGANDGAPVIAPASAARRTPTTPPRIHLLPSLTRIHLRGGEPEDRGLLCCRTETFDSAFILEGCRGPVFVASATVLQRLRPAPPSRSPGPDAGSRHLPPPSPDPPRPAEALCSE